MAVMFIFKCTEGAGASGIIAVGAGGGGENNRMTVPIYTETSLFSFCVFRD